MEITLSSKNTHWLVLIFGAIGAVNLMQGDWVGAIIWGGLAAGQAIHPPASRRMQIVYYGLLTLLVVLMAAQILSDILQ